MKNLINKLKSNLSNMTEKSLDEYIDYDISEILDNKINIPDLWDKLAVAAVNYYIDNHEKYLKTDNAKYDARFYYNVDDILTKCIGFDSIVIYFYFGYEKGYNSSNYIFTKFKDNGEKILYIDIYGCYLSTEEEIYENILQELYNFKRDTEWVIIGEDVYNKEIEKMKRKMIETKEKLNELYNEYINE